MKIIRINKERRNKWIHFTLVWLIGIIITTLVAFVSNQHFDDFPSFIIPVLVGGLICWIITRKDLQFVHEDRLKGFYLFLSLAILMLVSTLMNNGLSYTTGKKATVDQLTTKNIKEYEYLEVQDLQLDTSKTGTYIYQHLQHDRYSTNLEFEGFLVVQVKGLKDVYVVKNVVTSCSYDYASDEKIEETNQKVIERLQEIKSETPTHSHCYLSKFVKKDNIGYQNAVNAALDAGINNPKEEDNFVFFDLSSSTNVNPFWHNVGNSTIALAIWGLIIAAAFYFTKEKKRKRKRRKEEDTPLTKEDKKELFRFALIFWPIIAIAIICIVMYIVELAMGYNETSPDSEILYKLGALDSYKIFEDQSWWHLLAYAFLHSSVRHLLGNVFSLLFISYFMIIEVKPTWQAVIFLVSSIFSGLAYIAFSKGIVVGASGGIFGMTGAYITLALYDWAKTGQRQVGLMLIGVLCIINLLLSFARSVSMLGHLSGLACGFLFAIGIIIYREFYKSDVKS